MVRLTYLNKDNQVSSIIATPQTISDFITEGQGVIIPIRTQEVVFKKSKPKQPTTNESKP